MCTLAMAPTMMPYNDENMTKGCKGFGTPMSQMSTAPNTPAMGFGKFSTLSFDDIDDNELENTVVSCEKWDEAQWAALMPPLKSDLGNWAQSDPCEEWDEAQWAAQMPPLKSDLGNWAQSAVSCEEWGEAEWAALMPPLKSWLGRWAEGQVLAGVEDEDDEE